MKRIKSWGVVGTALALLLASVWIPVAGPFFSCSPLTALSFTIQRNSAFLKAVKLTCISILASGLIAAGDETAPSDFPVP